MITYTSLFKSLAWAVLFMTAGAFVALSGWPGVGSTVAAIAAFVAAVLAAEIIGLTWGWMQYWGGARKFPPSAE